MVKRTRAARRRGALVLVSGLLLSTAATAQARVDCGTETARSAGQIFRVVGDGVGCTTAKAVAGRWFGATSRGNSGRSVLDQVRRRWTCRVVERATGTDPGLVPYTSVRCARHRAVVSFKQRS